MARVSRIDRWFHWLLLAAGFALAIGASNVTAQPAYPIRPLKLIVPYPPGALTDILARAIAERLGASLKQPVVVDNKPPAPARSSAPST